MKTSELIGPALDWAVAKVLGHQLARDALLDETIMHGSTMRSFTVRGWWISGLAADPNKWMHLSNFSPSTNWSQGGPIIEQEKIDVISDPNGTACWLGRNYIKKKIVALYGPTPLIAAMRCYIASKLGDEVDIPAELIK